jgi:peptidoglycan/LPS O-acetylase OafA/YrhL
MKTTEHYRPEIDGLRALAVIPVLLFHAGVPGFPGGFVGVDVFFVISGFLITRIIHSEIAEGRFSIIRFYERRARRILPALGVVLFAATLVAAILWDPGELVKYGTSLVATVGFASNFWFWRTTGGYFAPEAGIHPLLHTWSLAVEEQFYIFFPLLMMLCARLAPKRVKLVVIAVVAVSFAYSLWRLPAEPREVFYLPLGRAWELGLGSMLALGLFPAVRETWRAPLGLVALALIIVPVLLYDATTPFPGLAALAPCLGAALVIYLGKCGSTRVLAWRPLVFVGLISYSLYLWHWPLIVLLHGIRGGAELPLSWAIGAIVASLILAWASWRFVERPFRRPGLFSQRAIFAFSGAVAATLVALAGGLWALRGIPQRFTPTELAVLSAQYDINARRAECSMQDDASKFCRMGARDAAPSFFLWGDSHADSAQPGFELAAERAGANGYISARWGCAPLVGVEQSSPGCSRANRATIDWLKTRPEIELVIFVARWPYYESGRWPDGRPAERFAFQSPTATPEGQAALFGTAIAQTVRQVSAMGKRVVILGDVPEIGWSVPRQLSALQRFGAPLPHIPATMEVAARHAGADATIGRLGVEFIRVYPRFCASDCRIKDANGIPLYSDGDHVTVPVSREIYAPLVEPLLRGGTKPPG